MAIARPGDVVRVEPGDYAEQVTLADGVDLVARTPGTVTISRPPALEPAMAGVLAGGSQPVRIAGLRITSNEAAPAETADQCRGAWRDPRAGRDQWTVCPRHRGRA